MENALIIFVRNTEKGKVKTRLAKELGDDKALSVYRFLLQHTRDVTIGSNCSHFVFYSSYVHIGDAFDDDVYTKFVQEGQDLGERMLTAFKKVFELGCKKVCILGSDCYDLQTELINEAFEKLDKNEVVLGQAKDGGYYLLGMKRLYEDVFKAKYWGTNTVFDDTIETLSNLNVAYAELQVLDDIDTLDDLLKTDILIRIQNEVAKD
jgi:rSAM/selenodomain-associated transferase 1